MRLIDADEIIKETWRIEIYGETVSVISRKDIDNAPTIKAIPVEWFKSKIDAILDSYPDGNEETEILCKLLYEWEKENENRVE